MNPSRRARRSDPGRWPGRTGSALGIAALLALALSAARAEAKPDRAPAPDETFSAVVGAWTARSAERVVGQMDPAPKATLTLHLFDPPVAAGSYLAAQAKQTLTDYFSKLKSASLTDVTSAESKRDAPHVRLYDYAHRREGRDSVTTRLEVTLKRSASGRWNLASVIERQRPRPS